MNISAGIMYVCWIHLLGYMTTEKSAKSTILQYSSVVMANNMRLLFCHSQRILSTREWQTPSYWCHLLITRQHQKGLYWYVREIWSWSPKFLGILPSIPAKGLMVTLSFYLVFSIVTLQLLVTFSIVVYTFSSMVRAVVQSNIQCLAKVFGPLELCDLLPHFRLQT